MNLWNSVITESWSARIFWVRVLFAYLTYFFLYIKAVSFCSVAELKCLPNVLFPFYDFTKYFLSLSKMKKKAYKSAFVYCLIK